MARDDEQELKRYDRGRRIARIDKIADWLDARYRIPGTRIRFGGDAVLGLIPGVGDTASLLLSLYLLREAQALNLPLSLKARMAGNIFLDWLVGLVPLAGDLLDIGFRANSKNVEIIRSYFRSEDSGPEVIRIHPRKAS